MLNKTQFRQTIKDVLDTAPRAINGLNAINLLMGTAAQESGFGHYLKQITGPAKGFFQIEPATAKWLEETSKPDLAAWLKSYRDDETIEWALEYRLDYQIACARLRYLKDKQPLPATDNIAGLAGTWKRVYNTHLGKGTEQEFVNNYKKYCL